MERLTVLKKHRRLLAQALGSSSVRTSFRDQSMLDFSEMGYSLDLPSVGKPLKQVSLYLTRAALWSRSQGGPGGLRKASLTLVVVRVKDDGDIRTGWWQWTRVSISVWKQK